MLGLGLGNDVVWCLEHPIKKIVVVESVPDVISLFKTRQPAHAHDSRLEIICGSFPECLNLEGVNFDAVIYSIDNYKFVDIGDKNES